MDRFKLHFDIQSYWQTGTGRGSGTLMDTMAHRDIDGLPCLAGRAVKGLLRDAVMRSETWGYIATGTADRWFGSLGPQAGQTRLETQAGALRVSDATLSADLINFLRYLKRDETWRFKELTTGFFQPVSSTAMEDGTAKDRSLRTLEVVIPLALTADVSTIRPLPGNWWKDLEQCLPLIRGVGNGRNRGLGRVHVTLMKEATDA